MTREDLKDDLSRLLLPLLMEIAELATERGPMTEARLSILCSKPSRTTAEHVVQYFERQARKEPAHGQA